MDRPESSRSEQSRPEITLLAWTWSHYQEEQHLILVPLCLPATRCLQLPMIYCIENNQYGMGTSKERSSSNSTYYTMGNHIPGFKLDGMNILMIREVITRTAETGENSRERSEKYG